ncbi:MAG TPA: 4-hydroxybenzoate octaprenyltransferase [Gammaproteobacteria bacterium]|nr:4-hydroxybenzoate octaprenyltransferase [Gammaproteobacteria bacterium]
MPRLATQLREYALLMRLHRPIGTLLLLWPTLWGLWIAGAGRPDPHVLLVFVAGVVLMRSAGCVMNDFADRRIDPYVARTRDRPLARGTVTPLEALLLAGALGAVAFGLVLTLNRLTVLLALAGAVLTVAYPFLKRFTHLPQIWLGASFGWSVPMAFAAQTGAVPQLAWLMFIAVVIWAVVYDTMYAMVDREDDLQLGVRSTAILFGDADRLIIGVLQVLLLVALALVGQQAALGAWYYGALLVAAGLALWQQWLIRERRPEDCFRAFLNNHYFGMTVFIGILLHYLFAPS